MRSITITRSELKSLRREDLGNASSLEELLISNSPLLKDIAEDTFEDLINLKMLYITNCGLADLKDGLFTNLPGLTSLGLQFNFLKSISDELLTGLTSLNKLELDDNNITGIEDGAFLHTPRLSSLDLSHNLLTSVDEHSLQGLQELKVLQLSYNQLSAIDGNALRHSPHLEILKLDHNALNFFSDVVLEGLTNLTELDLQANGFQSIPVISLSEASGLTHLTLSENPIETVSAGDFSALENLEHLSLEYMDYLKALEDGAFSGLTHLRELSIINCPVLTSLSKEALVPEEKQEMAVLRLSNNSIISFSEDIFTDLVSLQWVTISGNPLVCSCEVIWIRNCMEVNEPSWIESWKVGPFAVLCDTPSNIHNKRLAEIDFDDLTCEKPVVISKTSQISDNTAVFQVSLSSLSLLSVCPCPC